MRARTGRPSVAVGRLVAAAAPLAVGLVAYAMARSILLPGQGFWDTGEFQAVPPVLGTAHPTGYPSYVILGWLATIVLGPLGEPALLMNLLSAILLGVAAALTVVLVRALTGRTTVAVAAGLLLALTPIPWRMGAFADPHTLHLALSAGLLVLLVGWEQRRRGARSRGGDPAPGADGAPATSRADRWLVAAAALYGVMLGNHTLTILLAPGIALFVLVVEPAIVRRLRFVGLLAAVLVGTTVALYLELPIRAAMGAPLVYGTPNTWDGFWYVVLAEQFRGDLVNPFGDLVGKAGDLVSLASAQLGVLAAAIPAAFLLTAIRRPRFALLTGTWLVVTCWFAASYTNAAIDRYYLVPALLAISWLAVGAGLLVDALFPVAEGQAAATAPAEDEPVASGTGDPGAVDGAGGGRSEPGAVPRGTRPALGPLLVGAAFAVALVLPAAAVAPDTRARVDQSHDTRATDWSRWVLGTVGSNAVIVSWWSYSTPLWYRTVVLSERPDVTVLDDRDRLDENLGSIDDVIRASWPARPVYLVRPPAEIDDLAQRWVLAPIPDPLGQQPLYQVVGQQPAAVRRTSATLQATIARMGP